MSRKSAVRVASSLSAPKGVLRDSAAIAALLELGVEEVLVDEQRSQHRDEPAPAAETMAAPTTASSTPVSKTQAPTTRKLPMVTLEQEVVRAEPLYQQALSVIEQVLASAQTGVLQSDLALREVVQGFMASLLRNQDALLCLAHLRDSARYPLEHAINSCVLMIVFARYLRWHESDVEALALGALWHDIGKVRIDAGILDKPGRLSAEEMREVRRHVEYGLELVRAAVAEPLPVLTLAAIAEHHERLDGTGYPAQRRGDAISRAGRMMAIVDSYDALTGYRAYRQPVTATRAFKLLRADSDILYDAELVMAFIKAIGLYPVGTLVKLKSQRLALVIASPAERPHTPVVKVFYHSRFRQPLPIQDCDLAAPDCDDEIVAAVRPEQFKLDLLTFFRTAVLPS